MDGPFGEEKDPFSPSGGWGGVHYFDYALPASEKRSVTKLNCAAQVQRFVSFVIVSVK